MAGYFSTYELGDVAELYDSLHQTPQYVDDGYPMIRVTDIRRGFVETKGAVRVDEETYLQFSKKHKPQVGDILFSRVGSYGNSAYVNRNEEFCLGQNTVCISPERSRIQPNFLYFALNSDELRNQIESLVGGASQGTISLKNIRKLQVPLPPLPEQRRIAGILSAYDELIENNQRRIRILEEMARSLYREWFVHFRYPGHEAVPLVDSLLGQIPQGWEIKRVGDVAATFRGRSYRSVDLADEGGIPFLNLKCLDRDGGFRRSGLKRYIGDFKEVHLARKGDIVMAVTDMTQERRIVARAALVPSLDSEFGVFSMDLVRIEPKGEMPKVFLYSFFRYSSFADEVKQHANGANVLHLSPERITDFRFSVPPADLMERFIRFVAPSLEQMDVLQNQTTNLRCTRDLLLPRLLSGQLNLAADTPPITA